MMRRWIGLGLIVLLVVLSAMSMTRSAQAADVSIAAGDTQGLIDAINQANQSNQATTITLASNAVYTVTAVDHSPFYLFGKPQNMGTTGPDAFPVITVNITINGNGSTIARSGSALFRFFETFQTGMLTLNNLTLSGGNVGDSDGNGGGAISQIGGTLVLNNCVLTGNHAEEGGALEVMGTATFHQTRVENNSVPNASMGGGIDVSDSAPMGQGLILDDSDVDNNHADQGGGISIGGSATISNSRVENNIADTEGGGIYLDENGSVTVNNGSVIGGNHTVNDGSQAAGAFGGGGIDSYFGHVTVDSSVISDNVSAFIGGAMFDRGGTFAITNTLITRNQARVAAGILSMNIESSDGSIQRDGHITISGSCLVDNNDIDRQYKGMREGLDNDKSQPTIDAANNWWGDSSGPGPASGGGGGKGKGDGVGGSVTYQPFLNAEPDACSQAAASVTPIAGAPIQPTTTADQSSSDTSASGFNDCTKVSDPRYQIQMPTNALPKGSLVDCSISGPSFNMIVLTPSGAPLEKFNTPITICLQGSGTLSFVGLTSGPSLPRAIKTTNKNGYACASITGPGVLLLNL